MNTIKITKEEYMELVHEILSKSSHQDMFDAWMKKLHSHIEVEVITEKQIEERVEKRLALRANNLEFHSRC